MGRLDDVAGNGQMSLFDLSPEEEAKESLRDKYIVPPFSVLDSRQEYWQARKRLWKRLGIRSEEGRDAKSFHMGEWGKAKASEGALRTASWELNDTSVFDPVLCEVMYKWLCPKGGMILDPFAGGSVRGIVAGFCGYRYLGIDLSERQIAADIANAGEVFADPDERSRMRWVADDSANMDAHIGDGEADMVFSCPPYFGLERYSDKPEDLSNMDPDSFRSAYKAIIAKACKKLKDGRFAAFVVGDARAKDGSYLDLSGATKDAFREAGMRLWNEFVLVMPVASASLRASAQFDNTRKAVKVHQTALVFYKGDQSTIKADFAGEIEG